MHCVNSLIWILGQKEDISGSACSANRVDSAPGADRVHSAPSANRVDSAPGADRVHSAPGAEPERPLLPPCCSCDPVGREPQDRLGSGWLETVYSLQPFYAPKISPEQDEGAPAGHLAQGGAASRGHARVLAAGSRPQAPRFHSA